MNKRGKKLPASGCVMQGMPGGNVAVVKGTRSEYDIGTG